MKKLSTVILVLLIGISCSFAQSNDQSIEDRPYIEVTGTAEKEIVPDEIYITIDLRERKEGKDQASVEEQETKLKEGLKSLGVSLDDLSLSFANANYIRVRWTSKEVITSKEYVLKVGTAETAGKVFEKLDEIKIREAYISKVDHSKLIEFRKEVRIMAIKAAKDKADYLLEAIGEQSGKPIIIREESENSINNTYSKLRGVAANASYRFLNEQQSIISNNDDAIQFKKIKLKSGIYAKFEIK